MAAFFKRNSIFIALLWFGSAKAQQIQAFKHQAEIGISIGAGHYFGDLTPSNQILRSLKPKLAAGVFYGYQLSDYISLKATGTFAQLGYSDSYSPFYVYRLRNLSFNTNVWEISVSGIFNFFKFVPTYPEYRFTPYIGLGIGAFTYDPYAYLNGRKYYLRSLGTEGQRSAQYPGFAPYSKVAMSIPVTFGLKYALNEKVNIFGEFSFRFTNTDYLDDVSGTYAHDAFTDPTSPAFLLQDRSYEVSSTGTDAFYTGKQRGNSLQKDAFATIQAGISINFLSYRCPKQ